ncbi:MAG: response regulator transcription factor [Bacteroidales bacterium]|nr:response regulator transcription factor [Bacteroidales bacterium]
MIRILITDDHPVVRRGIRQLLEDDKEERFGKIEEAGSGKELLEKLNLSDFDVVLLDISLPGRSGLDLLVDIKKLKPALKVVILSIYPEEQYALRALKMGAAGYLTKASAPDELISAVIKASQGGRYISASLAEKITSNLIEDSDSPLHEKLSVRELEVLSLLATGKTMSNIANLLSLSPKTISTYRERILSKLKLKTTSDIIRYAIKEGLSEEK